MLGKKRQTPRKFLRIKNGKILQPIEGGKTEDFDYIEGIFGGVEIQERRFGSETALYWYFDFLDNETAERFSISVPYSSGVATAIILSLASATEEELSNPLHLETWERNGFSNIDITTAEERRLPWITRNLPEIKTINVGGKKVRDDSERLQVLREYADKINAKSFRK